MNRVKFLHCADLHMDMPFSSLGVEGKRAELRRQELKQVFNKIIGLVQQESVDMLLICGDMYEQDYVAKSTISFINEGFKSIPGTKVIILPGNHDPFSSNSYYRSFEWSSNVHILTRSQPSILIEDKGVCVYGIGFEGSFDRLSSIEYVKPSDPSLINFLLAHGSLDLNISGKEYNALSSTSLNSMGMDYIALGHFHNRFDMSRMNIYNPGSPEPLGFDEPGEHGVFIGCISKQETTGAVVDVNFVKTGIRFYKTLEVDAGGCCTDEQVIDNISRAVLDGNHSGGLYNIILKGYVDHDYNINESLVSSYFENKAFYMRVKNCTAPDYNFGEIAKEQSIRGVFASKVLKQIESASDDKRIQLLKRSLYFGMEALEKGKVEIN